jgi:hypothetical protein
MLDRLHGERINQGSTPIDKVKWACPYLLHCLAQAVICIGDNPKVEHDSSNFLNI